MKKHSKIISLVVAALMCALTFIGCKERHTHEFGAGVQIGDTNEYHYTCTCGEEKTEMMSLEQFLEKIQNVESNYSAVLIREKKATDEFGWTCDVEVNGKVSKNYWQVNPDGDSNSWTFCHINGTNTDVYSSFDGINYDCQKDKFDYKENAFFDSDPAACLIKYATKNDFLLQETFENAYRLKIIGGLVVPVPDRGDLEYEANQFNIEIQAEKIIIDAKIYVRYIAPLSGTTTILNPVKITIKFDKVTITEADLPTIE